MAYVNLRNSLLKLLASMAMASVVVYALAQDQAPSGVCDEHQDECAGRHSVRLDVRSKGFKIIGIDTLRERKECVG